MSREAYWIETVRASSAQTGVPEGVRAYERAIASVRARWPDILIERETA